MVKPAQLSVPVRKYKVLDRLRKGPRIIPGATRAAPPPSPRAPPPSSPPPRRRRSSPVEVHSAAMRAAAGTSPPFSVEVLPLPQPSPSLFLPVVACQLVAGAVLLAPVAADPAPMAAYPVPPGSLEPAPRRSAWGASAPGRPEGRDCRGSPQLRTAGALRRRRPRPGGRWGAAAAAPTAARCWGAARGRPQPSKRRDIRERQTSPPCYPLWPDPASRGPVLPSTGRSAGGHRPGRPHGAAAADGDGASSGRQIRCPGGWIWRPRGLLRGGPAAGVLAVPWSCAGAAWWSGFRRAGHGPGPVQVPARGSCGSDLLGHPGPAGPRRSDPPELSPCLLFPMPTCLHNHLSTRLARWSRKSTCSSSRQAEV